MRVILSSCIVHGKAFQDENHSILCPAEDNSGPSRVLYERSMPTVSRIDAVLSAKIMTTNLSSLAIL